MIPGPAGQFFSFFGEREIVWKFDEMRWNDSEVIGRRQSESLINQCIDTQLCCTIFICLCLSYLQFLLKTKNTGYLIGIGHEEQVFIDYRSS